MEVGDWRLAPAGRRGFFFKVLFGYTPGRGFLFVDPAYERRHDGSDSWKQHGLFWQEEKEFLRQWRGLFGIYIEAR